MGAGAAASADEADEPPGGRNAAARNPSGACGVRKRRVRGAIRAQMSARPSSPVPTAVCFFGGAASSTDAAACRAPPLLRRFRPPAALIFASTSGLAFGSWVDLTPLTAVGRGGVCSPGPNLVAQVAGRRAPPSPAPPPPPPSTPPSPALAPALIALGVAYLAGFVTGTLLARRRQKQRVAAAAALRASSGRDALQRARAVLDNSLDGRPAAAAASSAASAAPASGAAVSAAAPAGDVDAALASARAQAAEAGLATQTAQLRELQGALAIAGEEFEEALSDKAAAEEEVSLLRAILVEKDAQLRALEELANGALEESTKNMKLKG
jgi:hypothetical protein